MSPDVFEARHSEVSLLEEMVEAHIAELDRKYTILPNPTSHDTIAHYAAKVVAVQFQRALLKAHSSITNEQFIVTSNLGNWGGVTDPGPTPKA